MIELTDIPSTVTASKPRRPARARAGGQGIINLINLALVILTIRDIRRRRDEEINGRRRLWLLAAFAPPIGPIAYFIFGRKHGAQQDSSLSAAESAQPTDVTTI